MSAFLELFSSVPRQGPGLAKDVAWAVAQAGAEVASRVCDAGCGTGSDTEALLAAMPEAQVMACDKDATFLEAAQTRLNGPPRVRVGPGDLAALNDLPEAPFDFIWCAGAIYFLGTVKGLRDFRKALKAGGAVAFSAPVYFKSGASAGARAFWMDVPVPTQGELRAEVAEAGYELIADRPLSNAAWSALYTPLKAEIARRRGEGASEEMEGVMAAMEQEMALWSRVKLETGYQLVVARAK
ncbi:trans-aconitate 2-methyltransferase [Oceanicola sp. 502str15]|uniref:class I SAM-dependent methyltransferase n=1 Tax=Oceanicola sp. 502str15 TaxID=2696061 RepID=UPI002095AA40|nr:class I SAM-dependent methyltransferase [Oceanicola sp. 502str15]MCO6382288.1 methyltransferase domain-containing protein [Oceanicola sp. 502str15]